MPGKGEGGGGGEGESGEGLAAVRMRAASSELNGRVTHYDRCAALANTTDPAGKARNASLADWCRSRAEAM